MTGVRGRSWILIGVVGSLGGLLGDVPALAEPAGEGVVLPFAFDGTVPPEFNALAGQQMANVLTSCAGVGAKNSLKQLGDAILGKSETGDPLEGILSPDGGVGVGTACPKAGAVPDAPECSEIMVNGQVDPAKIGRIKSQANSAYAALKCQEGKLAAVQGELGCMANNAAMFSQQVASLQQAYVANMQRMQADVAQLKNVVEDRLAQLDDVKLKLGEDGNAGTPGLLSLKAQTMAMLTAMPTEIQGLREQQRLAVQQRRALQEQIETRTMALAGQCFNTLTSKDWVCNRKGSGQATIRNYMLCRIEDQACVGRGGERLDTKACRAAGAERARALDAILTAIFSDAPNQTKLPTKPEDVAAAMDQPLGILSIADLESQYGQSLEALDPTIHQFMLRAVTKCFSRAQRQVNREASRANTPLGQADFTVKQLERTNSRVAQDLMLKYSQQYAENFRGLTGQNLPLETGACGPAAAPAVQANCLDDIRNNMEGLLKGTTPGSGISMVVRGNNPQTNIVLNCQGLDGCITSLQNVTRNIQVEVKRVDQFKRDYVLRANQNAEAFTQAMAQRMSVGSQGLANQLKALNTAMASLGLRGVDLPPIDGEEPEFDEDGLMKPPKNALRLIGARLNPPLPDISGDPFGSALEGLADGHERLEARMGDAQKAIEKIAGVEAKCSGEAMKEAVILAREDIRNLMSARCGDTVGYCGQDQRLQDLVATIRSVASGGEDGLDSGAISSLSTGLIGACPKVGRMVATNKKKWDAADQQYREDRQRMVTESEAKIAAAKLAGDEKEADAEKRASRTQLDTFDNEYKKEVRERVSAYGEKDEADTFCGEIFTGLEEKVDIISNLRGGGGGSSGRGD